MVFSARQVVFLTLRVKGLHKHQYCLQNKVHRNLAVAKGQLPAVEQKQKQATANTLLNYCPRSKLLVTQTNLDNNWPQDRLEALWQQSKRENCLL